MLGDPSFIVPILKRSVPSCKREGTNTVLAAIALRGGEGFACQDDSFQLADGAWHFFRVRVPKS